MSDHQNLTLLDLDISGPDQLATFDLVLQNICTPNVRAMAKLRINFDRRPSVPSHAELARQFHVSPYELALAERKLCQHLVSAGIPRKN